MCERTMRRVDDTAPRWRGAAHHARDPGRVPVVRPVAAAMSSRPDPLGRNGTVLHIVAGQRLADEAGREAWDTLPRSS